VNDDRHLDDLERYLQHAAILEVATFQLGGAHQEKARLVLEGGVIALAKPEVGISPEGARVIAREVAAWAFARELGWADLLAYTVLRDVPLVSGGTSRASVQIVWPSVTPDHDLNAFSDEDTWRAGIFDAVIAHSDRTHNWLGFPEEAGGYRLKLVDHGYAFDWSGQARQSVFYDKHQGQQIPDQHLAALARCGSVRQERFLRELFAEADAAALDAALGRAQTLRANGILTI
jgi:hypothetical protein